jgi:hypothetical protein
MCDDDMMDQGEYVGYNTNYIGQQFTPSKVEIRYKEVRKMSILLDSQSTHSTFCSSKLLTNIRSVSSSLKMFSNGGMIISKQRGKLKNYGTVWFNEDAIANIILMSEAERKGHIISYTVGCLKLQNPSSGKVTSFHLTPGGLYAFRVPSNDMSFVQTVAENRKLFMPRQIAQAKVTRDLYAMIGRPSKNDFMGIINNNLLLNSPITAQDITNAETIFGKDIGSIQGKTAGTRPQRVIFDFVRVSDGILNKSSRNHALD